MSTLQSLPVTAAAPSPQKESPLTAEYRAICERYLPPVLEEGVIALVAGPAAGKGTNAKILSAYWGIPTISIGSLLRDRSETDDELGRSLKQIMKDGGLVQNEIVFELLEKHLTKLGNPKTFILDGCPRAMNQIEPLRELLAMRGICNISALYLKTTLTTALIRSAQRLSEDLAKGEPGRNDDKPETVCKRHGDFELETLPVTKVYAARNALAEADVNSGDRAVNLEAVAQSLGPVVERWRTPSLGDLGVPGRVPIVAA